jgi:hypothetical protein
MAKSEDQAVVKPDKSIVGFRIDEASKNILPMQRVEENNILFAVGRTLFAVNDKMEESWRFDALTAIYGFTYVKKQNTVYVISEDGQFDAIDLQNGKQKWHYALLGKAVFSKIHNFKDDSYIVVTDTSGYDANYFDCILKNEQDNTKHECKRNTYDIIELYEDNNIIGIADFPPGASLEVFGDHVWAITIDGSSVKICEILFHKPDKQ